MSSRTPPTFLTQTQDDSVRVESSLLITWRWRMRAPAELHLYPTGGQMLRIMRYEGQRDDLAAARGRLAARARGAEEKKLKPARFSKTSNLNEVRRQRGDLRIAVIRRFPSAPWRRPNRRSRTAGCGRSQS